MTNTVKHSVTWRGVELCDCELYELHSALSAFESAIALHDLQLEREGLTDLQITALYRARENDRKALAAISAELLKRTDAVAISVNQAVTI